MIEFILIFAFILYLLGFIIKPNKKILACGISGFSGQKNFDQMKLKFLMYMNSIERGKDATGVFTPKTGIIKDNIKAEDFIINKKYISKIQTDNVFIGHVRAKTVGINTIANAHPFIYDNVIGCHNGTLINHLDLISKYNLQPIKDYDVDSQILISCINENFKNNNGNLKVLSEYEGAAALLFYNDETNILYAYHDDQRPLFYGYINKTEMYISSIKDSLEAINCDKIKEFEEKYVYEIKEGKIIKKTKYKTYVNPNYTKLARYTDISTIYHKNDKRFRLSSNNITGFEWAAVEPEYLVGFWIKCNSISGTVGGYYQHGIYVGGTLKMNNWYKCIGFIKNNKFLIKIADDDKEVNVSLSSFDYKNFIPIKNKFVVLMQDIFYEKTKQSAGKKGDILTVVEYKYGNKSISVKNNKNKEINAPLEYFRIATDDESKNYIDNLKQPNDILIEFNDKPEEVVNNTNTDLVILDKPIIEEDEEEEEIEEFSDEYIPFEIFEELLDLIQCKVAEISEKHQSSLDITVDLFELESLITNSYDTTFILNLADTSETNV